MLELEIFFRLQNRVSVFEILIFNHDIWRNVHYIRITNLFFKEL